MPFIDVPVVDTFIARWRAVLIAERRERAERAEREREAAEWLD